jgi:TATA-binding protein-associated factor
VSVLALDRFGDFVSDCVVAPVRETAAQCLATLAARMEPNNLRPLTRILLRLLGAKAWEVRHGALLALKYVFAVRRVSFIRAFGLSWS